MQNSVCGGKTFTIRWRQMVKPSAVRNVPTTARADGPFHPKCNCERSPEPAAMGRSFR